jgi:2,4-diketo-3-deoxy-L-fuconate hydrolase
MKEAPSTVRFQLGTFSSAGCPPFPGLVIDGKVIALAALRPLCERLGVQLSGTDSVLSLLESWPGNFAALRALATQASGFAPSKWVPVERLDLHPPVNLPRQIFGVGANYRQHVMELLTDRAGDPETEKMTDEELRAHALRVMDERAARGTPYVFLKAPSSVVGPNDAIVVPDTTRKADWELELGVIVGRAARHVPRDKAYDYIAGYTLINDVTNRDLLWRRDDMKAMGTDWLLGKCSPSYLPMGPFLVPAAFVNNPQDLGLTLKLNGQVMQDASSSDMIFDIARQIEYISAHVQLWPGDLIMTGSPAGNGTHYKRFIQPGDVIESTITGLGTQRNPCVRQG